MLKENNWTLWKLHLAQAQDRDIRMGFSKKLLAWIKEEPNLLRHIVWPEETVFHVSDVNRHNCHYWAFK